MTRKNPARAGRQQYTSKEVREMRDFGPYYTVKTAWTTIPPYLTEDHFNNDDVRDALAVFDDWRSERRKATFLGKGNFGEAYVVETANGPVLLKVPAKKNIHGKEWTLEEQRENLMHEAGVANELAELGYDAVPLTVYVEDADGNPALVREYGEPVTELSGDEYFELENQLQEIEEQSRWRVQDDIVLYRREDGRVFVGDVGIWQPETVRDTQKPYNSMDSSLSSLLSQLTKKLLGETFPTAHELSKYAEMIRRWEGVGKRDPFRVANMKIIREGVAARDRAGVPSPDDVIDFLESLDEPR